MSLLAKIPTPMLRISMTSAMLQEPKILLMAINGLQNRGYAEADKSRNEDTMYTGQQLIASSCLATGKYEDTMFGQRGHQQQQQGYSPQQQQHSGQQGQYDQYHRQQPYGWPQMMGHQQQGYGQQYGQQRYGQQGWQQQSHGRSQQGYQWSQQYPQHMQGQGQPYGQQQQPQYQYQHRYQQRHHLRSQPQQQAQQYHIETNLEEAMDKIKPGKGSTQNPLSVDKAASKKAIAFPKASSWNLFTPRQFKHQRFTEEPATDWTVFKYPGFNQSKKVEEGKKLSH